MFLRSLFGIGVFLGSMGAGWGLRRMGRLTEARASMLVRGVVTWSSPVVLCLSFWRMELRAVQPWLLPLIGMVVSCSTMAPALLYARRARLTPPQTGSFLTCAIFSNVGYLGAFTAFALFGEAGYALCMAYLAFFSPCFYTIGFWIASHYGHPSLASAQHTLLKQDAGELTRYPIAGMLLGIALSLAEIPRPLLLEQLNHVLIPLSTALYLIAVGSQLAFDSPRPRRGTPTVTFGEAKRVGVAEGSVDACEGIDRPWWRACVAMSAMKFLYTPLVAAALLAVVPIHGLARTIVLLESATPVAVSPLVLPLLFGLDRRLSNALWFFTTLASIPVFLVLIPLLRLLAP